MINVSNNADFKYTYSASRQEEIRQIRSKYIPKEENGLDRLRRLDAGAARKATMYALIIGITGTLILGAGMSLCLVRGTGWMFIGIVVGVVGMAILGFAYPVYNRVLKKEMERIAPEVIRLTDELMQH